ncbi:hypothetical protein QGM71_11430 [Virgibacillus sp. C22-A2]|uniref:Uncharacterized protein n=1 Tax=Virgibacillus tibetensis TaxID=3042313 RepID=A0ABU6KG23_9BACI|nr:hypothetical protein [Virgibacillus sp. C22-A2]
MEETGVKVSLTGITGIYQNISSGIICVVFRGHYISGELTPAEGETTEVIFSKLTKENASELIKKPHFRSRAIDAMEPTYLPYEMYTTRPFELIKRFEGNAEESQ